MTDKNPYPFPPPKQEPTQWDVKALTNHLKTAMVLELATTPLYLCTIYSFKDSGDQYRSKIRGIVRQEMLHLALAGNILCSIGEDLALYNKATIPRYPSKILIDETDMKLRPADAVNLQSFVDIEKPFRPKSPITAGDTIHLLPKYNSIGEFYESVKTGINALCPTEPCTIFQHNQDKQFTEFFQASMVVVKDKATALQALETIVTQGEGSLQNPNDPNSHFNIFKECLEAFSKKPWGYYKYIQDPSTDKYKPNPLVYKLSLAFDALYCYLLQTIDLAWKTSRTSDTRSRIVQSIRTIMRTMSQLAALLVAQDLNGESPAPCFEFYPPNGDPLSRADLFKALNSEIDEASKLGNQSVEAKLKDIKENLGSASPAPGS